MRKVLVLVVLVMFIVGPSLYTYAQQSGSTVINDVATYRLQVGDKAARGAKNVLFGWTELPKRIVDITKETNNPVWGVLAGTFQGTLKSVARTASGVSDVVTAPVMPEKDPLMQADIDVQ